MNATHFRQQAARAREMAQSGDDVKISRMLLEVAEELDAEADAMADEEPVRWDHGPSTRTLHIDSAHLQTADVGKRPVEIIDLHSTGAVVRTTYGHKTGAKVVLEFANLGLRLGSTVLWRRGEECGLGFTAPACSDPGLERLLRWLSSSHDQQTLLATG